MQSAALDTPGRVALFVPGRVCLLGEHSDWAGEYRRTHAEIHRGECLVYGTDVGIHAVAFLERTADEDGLAAAADQQQHGGGTFTVLEASAPREVARQFEAPLTEDALTAVARAGGFYSYMCGTAAVMLERLRLAGVATAGCRVRFEVTAVSLPMGKGLSSSAAICVLVARGFSHLFGLNWSVEEEMEAAYRGERLTPSHCGRMDQCCAYGSKFVSMVFDGDSMRASPVVCACEFFFVVADLCAKKNTHVILSKLAAAFPDAAGDVPARVREFLGPGSWAHVQAAKAALAAGDAAALGAVFDAAQRDFDASLQPACPEELTAPRLHAVLTHPTVRAHVLGGKGVGSQGDGSVQFVCQGRAEQLQAMDALAALGCHPYGFVVGGRPITDPVTDQP